MDKQIICNQARCLYCDALAISHHRHHYNTCSCGSLSVDGGDSYLKRSWDTRRKYKEESVYSDAPFEVLRMHSYRGSRGPNGDQPLTWVRLCDMSDQYLDNLIAYQEDKGYTESIHYRLQLLEREYRGYI